MSGKKYRGFLAGLVFLAAMPFGTVRAFALESLPGRELWQPYLTQSAQGAADFARDPVSALLSLLPGSPVQLLVDTLHSYADLLLFLLLLTALSFLVGDAADGTLLDLAAAGGCGVLIWGDLLTLAQSIGERMDSWRLFLTGFLPVCGAVLTAGGEGNAGAVASGFLLSVLALLAQGIALCIRPLLQSYLAISMACCIHAQTGLPEACRMSGQLLRKSISAGGKLFALLLGVQRVITLQLDHTTSRLGQMLTGRYRIGRAAAAQKLSWNRGTGDPWRGICSAVSGTVVPPGSSVRVQASVQLCRHRPVPGAVCLSDGGGPVHGGGHGTVLFADNGRCRVDDNDERRVKCGS